MQYLDLNDLKIYKLARQLSKVAWEMFIELNWEGKKSGGFQFIESTDSAGANIAEGYGRFHYLDRRKFCYNSRGSLLESRHWFELLNERNLLTNNKLKNKYLEIYKELRPALNGYINSLEELKP